jgi:hypothetical protein
VFGVSHEHIRRMQLVLDQVAQAERSKRIREGVGSMGFGTLMGAVGVGFLLDESKSEGYRWGLGGGLTAVGTMAVVFGGLHLAGESSGEAVSTDFRRRVETGEDPVQALATADEQMRELERQHQAARRGALILGGVATGLGVTALVLNEATTEDSVVRTNRRHWSIAGLFTSGMMIADSLTQTSPSEMLAEVWREDPGINQYRPTVSVGDDQATVGLWGTW